MRYDTHYSWYFLSESWYAVIFHQQQLKAIIWLTFAQKLKNISNILLIDHTARAPNLRHDLITAKVSCVIQNKSDWSIIMS